MNQFPGTNYHDLNLNWLLGQMKNCLAEWETTKGQWTALAADNEEFKEYVTNYLANLDLTQEISDKINAMVEDGTLLRILTEDEGEGSPLSDTVGEWLAAHITQETGYVIDDTLTVQGAAADAKAAGDAIADLKGAIKNISVSQVSGYYNLIPKLPNAQIYNNKRMGGFNTSGETPIPNLVDQNGYVTIIAPVSSFDENVTIKWEPGSEIPNNYGIISRYSTTGTGYNMVSNSAIETYSGWDFSYNSTTHIVTVLISAIATSSTDMLVFCWYDQRPFIYPSTLNALDSGTIQLKNIIGKDQLTTNLQNDINKLELEQSASVVLPRRIPVVSGVQLGVYYENILYGRYLRTAFLNKQQDTTNGTFRDDSWHFTPNVSSLTSNGSNFRFYPYSLDSYVQYSTNVVAVPASYASGNYKGIVIGDSKIALNTIMDTLNSLFTNDTATNVQFMGKLQTPSGVKHEGRAGWSAKNYCESASYNGSTNPFLNNGAFDFANYLSANIIDTPDFVCINLGTNDVANLGTQYNTILGYYDTMIASIRNVSEDIKIIIGLTENMCQLQFNYSTNKDRILGLVKAMITKWDNDTALNNKIYLCPIYVNMNLYKDYNFSNIAESDRNPELIPFPTDYVHQSTYGFYKNADMIYSSIKYFLGT